MATGDSKSEVISKPLRIVSVDLSSAAKTVAGPRSNTWTFQTDPWIFVGSHLVHGAVHMDTVSPSIIFLPRLERDHALETVTNSSKILKRRS
jgi:hypothetical protein